MGTRIRKSPDRLFELFCEIGIPSSTTECAWVGWKFPLTYKDEETLKTVPEFAYPLEFSNNAVQHFSFVLTNMDSKWTFGFCRHAPSSPSCLVILSFLPWHETFYRILNQAAELSNRVKNCDSPELRAFLEALYKHPVPDPGLEFRVHHGDNKEFVATCPDHSKLPSIPENRNMTEYFNAVDAQNMMIIFASMLHERRILITSKKLSRLSACIQAANSLIYPMHWQHIFIPVLPKHLLDYLNAPMPFLIGVPASTFSRMKLSDIGDVVLLDADSNKVESPYADLDALPSEVLQSLRHDLKRPQEMLGDSVARAFLKASVKLIGGYWNALKLKPGEKISFSSELFVQTRPAPMQPFLEKMLQLQIFQQFIESRLKMLNSGQGVNDEFEFELTAHEDKVNTRLRNQYKDWVYNMKKEGGAFFKNVKIKVKDTGKKAYKDIRSRIHDMHHHKIVEDDGGTRTYRKRGSSVPSLFLNGLDIAHHSLHKSNGSSNDVTTVKTKEDVLRMNTRPNEYGVDSEKKISGNLDSPDLTFKPIDMDLMGDLQDLIFRNCSLCNDHDRKRTSISDPQLIDFNIEATTRKCSADCPSRTCHLSGDTKDQSPPPLLPRPPASRQASLKNIPSASASFRDKFVEKPLIELDGEDCNNVDVEGSSESFTMEDRNTNTSILKSFSTSNVRTTPISNNHVDSPFSNVHSTNPFINSTSFHSRINESNSNVPSSTNVRNMINMWQSTSPDKPAVLQDRYAASNTNANIPKTVPFRSQPLSRTVSTPPSTYSNVSGITTAAGNFNNPFLKPNESHIRNENSRPERLFTNAKNTSSSWESFQ